jgi:hypothetical protein
MEKKIKLGQKTYAEKERRRHNNVYKK